MDDTTPELELQQELERFTTRFTDRVVQATGSLESSGRPGVGDEALRKNLLYVSSAIEIATGADPEINLLDMVVFVHLCRTVLERHWIPELYGGQGADLADAFARAEGEVSEVAGRALGKAKRDEVVALADSWLADNPAQVRVEGVRLSDFAAAAGSAAAERMTQVKGLLSSVKGAARSANQALLLSERALFLVHRLPFLWRLQARLAAREMVSDGLSRLIEGPQAPLERFKRQAGQLARKGLLTIGLIGAAVLILRPTAARR
jgi:hypothetical protein